MPNKLRTQYNQQSLYVGPCPATGKHYNDASSTNYVTGLYRIQSCNYSVNISRTPVYQFGEQVAIDRPILETPTVSLSANYLLANAWNEKMLGLVTDGKLPALSGIVNRTQDEKNWFLKIVNEGKDSVGDTTAVSEDVAVIGFGNGFLNSYSTQASVGSFPTVDFSVSALNMVINTGISGRSPAINPANGLRVQNGPEYDYSLPTALSSPGAGDLDISVLRPGDITLTIKKRYAPDEGILSEATADYDTIGPDIDNANIQSYSLSFDLGREPLQALGSRFAKTRFISFPVEVTCSIDALAADLTTGAISDIIDNDHAYDIKINIVKPVPPGTAATRMMEYRLKNAKLNSQSYSNGIGDNKTVSLEFSASVGSASQSNVGLFISGVTS